MKAGIHLEQLQYNTDLQKHLLVRIGDNVSEPPHYNGKFDDKVFLSKYTWFYQEERRLFSHLKIQTGVRYDQFRLPPKGHLNPRIVVDYDLPKGIRTRVAFGTFSTLPGFGEMRQHMLERFEPGYKPGDSKIEFQYIDKYMVGFEKAFASHILLGCNYFHKDMKNLIPIQRLGDGSLLYDIKNRASAMSRGFDIDAKLDFDMISVTARYKYADSFENNNDRQTYAYYLDQRHALLLSLNANLPQDYYIGLQAIYGSGYAYTPCTLPEFDWELGYDRDSTPIWEYQTDNPNSTWYPAYSRLDIAFRKGFNLPFGAVTMSVNLINVLNTHHTFSYINTYDQNGEPIRQSESLIPFFPQVGLAYQF